MYDPSRRVHYDDRGVHHESAEDRKVSAGIGLILSAVYAVLILLVYFSQTTTVRLEALTDQASRILDYQSGGLMFDYDLLGYGIMALSTFFTGLAFVHFGKKTEKK